MAYPVIRRFNIELTSEEARELVGHMANFGTIRIFLPKTASFEKLENLSKQAAIARASYIACRKIPVLVLDSLPNPTKN